MLEKAKPTDCVTREQFWINFYDSANPKKGYNISPTTGSMLGMKHSDVTKELISLLANGRKVPDIIESNKRRKGEKRTYPKGRKSRETTPEIRKSLSLGYEKRREREMLKAAEEMERVMKILGRYLTRGRD